MCHQRLQRAINHGDDAAFNSPAQQISQGSLALFLIDSCIRSPALILRVDIGKHFVERFELEETVKSECDRMTILQQWRCRRAQSSSRCKLLSCLPLCCWLSRPSFRVVLIAVASRSLHTSLKCDYCTLGPWATGFVKISCFGFLPRSPNTPSPARIVQPDKFAGKHRRLAVKLDARTLLCLVLAFGGLL